MKVHSHMNVLRVSDANVVGAANEWWKHQNERKKEAVRI